MQSILTKCYGPSNVRGSRIIAQCEAGRIIMPYDHALNIEGNHIAAAKLLRQKLANGEPGSPWLRSMACGTLPKGKGMAHVFIPAE